MNETKRRFEGLARIYDPNSQRYCESLGIRAGWKCLEIGGGGGTFAKWLSTKVGNSGEVLVTDLDTRFLENSLGDIKNVRVIKHDISKDQLPDEQFDLIHSRLVFQHIPEGSKALARVIPLIAQNGYLFIEDFDSLSQGEVIVGYQETRELFLKMRSALFEVFKRHKMDAPFGVKIAQLFRDMGLKNIVMEVTSTLWQGGGAGCLLQLANYEQIHDEILSAGLLTESDFQQGMKLFRTEGWGFSSPRMYSVWGKKA